MRGICFIKTIAEEILHEARVFMVVLNKASWHTYNGFVNSFFKKAGYVSGKELDEFKDELLKILKL